MIYTYSRTLLFDLDADKPHSTDEVGKILREQWKDMSEQERKPYEKMAEAYVERFDFQKAR